VKILLTADGGTGAGGAPLIMHNERLADPLDSYTRAIAKISKKKKTEADHREIARLEFLGGLYTDDSGPCVPAFNVLRCLQDGAKRQKRGADVLRGVVPLTATASLSYAGPRDPDELIRAGGFALRKAVGVQRARTMRTRPMFVDWSFALAVEVDPTVFDPDVLGQSWRDAGVYAGIGDMRPIYGKFRGTLVEWPMTTTDGFGEAAYALANAVSSQRIQLEDKGRLNRLAPVEALLEEAVAKARELHQRAVTVARE
jgi:hypothetical protein